MPSRAKIQLDHGILCAFEQFQPMDSELDVLDKISKEHAHLNHPHDTQLHYQVKKSYDKTFFRYNARGTAIRNITDAAIPQYS